MLPIGIHLALSSLDVILACVYVQGLVAMSSGLEVMHTSLLNRQVPRQWAQVGYPSLKPLGPWLKDLQDRLVFFSSWLRRGAPPCFWLAAFFFPQVTSRCGCASESASAAAELSMEWKFRRTASKTA